MKKLAYKEAYDKIIDAYFKDEIEPMNPQFCFCGTLYGGLDWMNENTLALYSDDNLVRMEEALLSEMEGVERFEKGKAKWKLNKRDDRSLFSKSLEEFPTYEDNLFKGMCAALDVLKEIHRERGEDVDNLPILTKRNENVLKNRKESLQEV